MSIQATVTKHVYIWKYGVQQVIAGDPLAGDNVYVTHSDDAADDRLFYLCPIEITVDVPSAEQAHLMELAGCEKELAEYRTKSLQEMSRMAEKIQELKALTLQDTAA